MDEVINAHKTKWFMRLWAVDPSIVAPALKMTEKAYPKWPPNIGEFMDICYSIKRDRRMAAFEGQKVIENYHPEVGARSVSKIMLMLRGGSILNPWQKVHGMKAYV